MSESTDISTPSTHSVGSKSNSSTNSPTEQDLERRLQDALSATYWDQLFSKSPFPEQSPTQPCDSLLDQIKSRGYGIVPQVIPEQKCEAAIQAIRRVRNEGWLEVWAFMHDALWEIIRHPTVLAKVEQVLGADFLQLTDFWAMYVDGSHCERGFLPHPDASGCPLVEDNGRPTTITVWIPLTEATLENGCIYLLPGNLAEEYEYPLGPRPPILKEEVVMQVIKRILHRGQAVPASQGSIVCWNHGIWHWGSKFSGGAPRVSLSTEFIAKKYCKMIHPHMFSADGKPYRPRWLDPSSLPPNFEQRLNLIAKQVLHYHSHASVRRRSAALAVKIAQNTEYQS